MARNRYVVEITYKRAKEWHLLKEVIEVEDFYLMNAVWLWSMGFSNHCHKFLQPPPDVETQAQRARRLDRAEKEQAAGRWRRRSSVRRQPRQRRRRASRPRLRIRHSFLSVRLLFLFKEGLDRHTIMPAMT